MALACFSQRGRLVVVELTEARVSPDMNRQTTAEKKHVHHLFSPLIAAKRAGSMMCQIKMRLLELFLSPRLGSIMFHLLFLSSFKKVQLHK